MQGGGVYVMGEQGVLCDGIRKCLYGGLRACVMWGWNTGAEGVFIWCTEGLLCVVAHRCRRVFM